MKTKTYSVNISLITSIMLCGFFNVLNAASDTTQVQQEQVATIDNQDAGDFKISIQGKSGATKEAESKSGSKGVEMKSDSPEFFADKSKIIVTHGKRFWGQTDEHQITWNNDKDEFLVPVGITIDSKIRLERSNKGDGKYSFHVIIEKPMDGIARKQQEVKDRISKG